MTNDRVYLTTGELEYNLVEQLWLLRDAVGVYFNEWWQPVQALNVATRVRVLVNHHGRQRSLLEQLGIRKGSYLHAVGHGNSLVAPGMPHPGPRVFMPYAPWEAKHMIPFDDWWMNENIRYAPGGPLISRWGLVSVIANQAGGAHVDPDLDEQIAILRRHQPHGWRVFEGEGEDERPMSNFEMATVRNIGLELLWTLDHNHGEYIRNLRERAGDTDLPFPALLPPPGVYGRPDDGE